MATRMNFFERLWARWKRWWRRTTIDTVVNLEGRSELPKNLGESAYVVGRPEAKWVVLSCPCGCGEQIDVNLMRSGETQWRLSQKEGTISLRPSLWMPNDKCGSHFWIKDSRIIWVD